MFIQKLYYIPEKIKTDEKEEEKKLKTITYLFTIKQLKFE